MPDTARPVPASEVAAGEIVLIDARGLVRECFVRSLQTYLRNEVVSFPSLRDWNSTLPHPNALLVILSIGSARLFETSSQRALSNVLSTLPAAPTMVLSDSADPSEAIDAIKLGARGLLSTNMDLLVAVRAINFVLAGGTFVPVECLLSGRSLNGVANLEPSKGLLTSRELSVINAIRQGKSNKLIAYNLNMCESTVKVHVRHIMKKLQARNRTEVAIKSSALLQCDD